MFDPQVNFWGSFDAPDPRFPRPCISQSSVRRIAKRDLRLKTYKRLSGLLSFDRRRHLIFQSCFW